MEAPPGFQRAETANGVRWTRLWRKSTRGLIYYAVFTAVWNGGVWGAILGGFLPLEDGNLLNTIIPPVFAGMGVILAYWVLCLLVNRTAVALEGGQVRVTNGPLPLRRGAAVDLTEVTGFYTEEKFRDTYSGTINLYEVWARRGHGKPVALVKELSDSAQALYLEKELTATVFPRHR